jgi:hypothetical protein
MKVLTAPTQTLNFVELHTYTIMGEIRKFFGLDLKKHHILSTVKFPGKSEISPVQFQLDEGETIEFGKKFNYVYDKGVEKEEWLGVMPVYKRKSCGHDIIICYIDKIQPYKEIALNEHQPTCGNT